MTGASYNSTILPLNFQYTWNISGRAERIKINKTITADVTHIQDYYAGDWRCEFSCKDVSDSVVNLFLTPFQDGTTKAFVDYDSVSTDVIILEFSYTEHDGYYDIEGKMKEVV